MRARDIMNTRFHTLRPDHSIAETVRTFHDASTAERKKIFGLMVTDEQNRLVGMLSMYDILLFVRPKHAGLWGEMDGLPLYRRPPPVANISAPAMRWLRFCRQVRYRPPSSGRP